MPSISILLNAIHNVSSNGVFLTTDVITYLLGRYYCNIATTPRYSYNANIGKLIARIPNIKNLGTVSVSDNNNRKSNSAKWKL